MATNNDVKNIARQLYRQGHETAFIAQRCDVSLRTVQRWVKSFERETVRVTAEPETPVTEVLPALDRIANTSPDSISVSIIPSTAVRLLNLADASIAAVESVLRNPDSSDANKMRAAAIASKWVGLEATNSGKNPTPSVISTIAKKSGVSVNVESSESSELQLTPTVIEDKRYKEHVKQLHDAETERKKQEEIRKRKELEDKRMQEEIDWAMRSIAGEIAEMNEPYPYEKIMQHPLFDFDSFITELHPQVESKVFCKIVKKMVELLELSTEDFSLIMLMHPDEFPKVPYLKQK